jgi:hypothetical protein
MKIKMQPAFLSGRSRDAKEKPLSILPMGFNHGQEDSSERIRVAQNMVLDGHWG